VNQLAAALKEYEGTHKFHNYTSGKKFDDASAARYILSFTVKDRVVDKYGVEWIPTLVVGQSFLLHQIRKMMSMAMDAARGASSVDIMKDSFSSSYLNVNTAPAQGLFLELSYYDNFNRRHKAGDPLDWHSDETAPATLRLKKFKEDKIMSHIMDEEESQGNFVSYLFGQEHHLKYHNYELVDEMISSPR
jgi:tRNA pseudouridine38-40 synthase